MQSRFIFRFLAGSAIIAATSFMTSTAAHAQFNLTGVLEFQTDANGNFNSGGFFNTNRPDGPFDLAVIAGPAATSAASGTFLNDPTSARVSINLATPGTFTFTVLGGIDSAGAFNGLNLFFNGNDSTPGISVFAPQAGAGAFSPNTGSTSNLQVTAAAPGAGATFTANGFTATVSEFRFGNAGVYSPPVDRLGRDIDSGPDGQLDAVGQFTLVVTTSAITAAPEPGTVALVAMGLMGTAGMVIRRRK